MPRHYARRIKPYSKPFRRYGKRYGRARWKNKKFIKFNNKTRASIKGLIMPKSAYVKLPWRQYSQTVYLDENQSQGVMWVPNAYIPQPSDYSVSGSLLAKAGDKFTNGIIQYAQFFDTGYVLGSSLKLQIMNTNSQNASGFANPNLLAILVSYPFNSITGTLPAGDDVSTQARAIYDYLETLTDDNLQSLSFAQSRMITFGFSKSEIFMKMFRKTKSMCGVKDVEDNDDMEIRLPKEEVEYDNNAYGASQGYVYYLRIRNLSNNPTGSGVGTLCRINAKLTQYWKLTNRSPVLQGVVPSAIE